MLDCTVAPDGRSVIFRTSDQGKGAIWAIDVDGSKRRKLAEGSFFASPARFGPTRWVWIDPSVGHRTDALVAGDLDVTSVRAAALSEW